MIGCEAAMIGCEAVMIGCEEAMTGCDAAMVGCEAAMPLYYSVCTILMHTIHMHHTNAVGRISGVVSVL